MTLFYLLLLLKLSRAAIPDLAVLFALFRLDADDTDASLPGTRRLPGAVLTALPCTTQLCLPRVSVSPLFQ